MSSEPNKNPGVDLGWETVENVGMIPHDSYLLLPLNLGYLTTCVESSSTKAVTGVDLYRSTAGGVFPMSEGKWLSSLFAQIFRSQKCFHRLARGC